jgi:hypothetical protein
MLLIWRKRCLKMATFESPVYMSLEAVARRCIRALCSNAWSVVSRPCWRSCRFVTSVLQLFAIRGRTDHGFISWEQKKKTVTFFHPICLPAAEKILNCSFIIVLYGCEILCVRRERKNSDSCTAKKKIKRIFQVYSQYQKVEYRWVTDWKRSNVT